MQIFLKVNSDLERIADLAVNLAERGIHLAQFPSFPYSKMLSEMIALATQMTRDALNAFLQLNASAAKNVVVLQDQIEAKANEMVNWIGDQVRQSPNLIPAGLHCFSASRHVERIGSHAAASFRRRQTKHRPQALATGEDRVPHRLMNGRRAFLCEREIGVHRHIH